MLLLSEVGGEGRVVMARSQDGWLVSASVSASASSSGTSTLVRIPCSYLDAAALVSTMIVEDVVEPVLDIGTEGVRRVRFPLVLGS